MELRTYWDILWRRKWVIVVTFLTTLAATISGTLETTPIYQASAVVRVRVASGSTISSADYYYADRLINTYSQIAASKPVLEEVAAKLNLARTPEITVQPIANSELIRVTVEHRNPRLAADIANALAETLVARSNELYTGGGRTASEILAEQLDQVEHELEEAQAAYERLVTQAPEDVQQVNELSRIIGLKQGVFASLLEQYETARTAEGLRSNALSIIDPASIPTNPIKPNKMLNVALGCVVGMIGGIGLAFIIELLDTRLHTVEQMEDVTSLPVLGRIPYARKGAHTVFADGSSPQREAYRQLRTGIFAAARQGTLRRLLVTSAIPHEGKSTVVTNLAVAFAQAGHKVLVIDADLRQPTLHTNFCLPNRIGLSSVLRDGLDLREAAQSTMIDGVSVLTSGPLATNPCEMLGSARMETLLEEILESFDMVLVDAPAFLPVADTAVITPMVDGVLVVARRAKTEKEPLQTTCRALLEAGAKLIGLVATGTDSGRGHQRYYQYYRLPDEAVVGDPLTEIDGISPLCETALNAFGIVRYTQIAEQDPETLARAIGDPVITAERIRQDRWVEQAQALVDGKSEGPGKGNGR